MDEGEELNLELKTYYVHFRPEGGLVVIVRAKDDKEAKKIAEEKVERLIHEKEDVIFSIYESDSVTEVKE